VYFWIAIKQAAQVFSDSVVSPWLSLLFVREKSRIASGLCKPSRIAIVWAVVTSITVLSVERDDVGKGHIHTKTIACTSSHV
jgi:hypothetical protein